MDMIGFIGGGAFLIVTALLVLKYFPEEIAEFVRRLSAPSTSSIKQQSEERLAEMDRNVAERKARRGR